ncbi:MAG: hypothetical protein C0407_07825 [Desulfobacca sp.]|nr:hypothetical protein [Desulfobacca sp.]
MFLISRRWKPILAGFFGVILIVSLVSCGKKANPVIPVKILPKAVDSLSAQVKGKSLVVSWMIPTQQTDGSPLTDLKGFKFLKGEWATRDFCPTCPDQFQETKWIDLKGPQMPDLTIESDRVELVFSKLQPGLTYSFQVTALTKKESTSQPSKTLRVAWELPLMAPSKLAAKPQDQGLEISWEPPHSLVDGSLPQGLIGYSLYRRMGKGPWVKVTPDPIKSLKYLDDALQEAASYTYQIKALRQVQGTFLESEGSEEKEIVFTRIGPPPVIQEVLGVANPGGIEIRWQSLENVISSGYHVYKRRGNETKPNRITRELLKDTTFQDRQVIRGTQYFYSITVVGAPPALREGPKSKEIEIIFNP